MVHAGPHSLHHYGCSNTWYAWSNRRKWADCDWRVRMIRRAGVSHSVAEHIHGVQCGSGRRV